MSALPLNNPNLLRGLNLGPLIVRSQSPHAAREPVRTILTRTMLRASYLELHRLADSLLKPPLIPRAIDPRTLVNEAARHTLGASGVQDLADRGVYFAFLANALRRVLIDLIHEGDGTARESWFAAPGLRRSARVVALVSALDRLEQRSPRHAQIAVLRMFGGLTDREVAEQLGVTPSRAEVGWRRACEWLEIITSRP